jgi:Tfp pilus assembly protein PilE
MKRQTGITVAEALTAVVALAVIVAVAVPMWHTQRLRAQRRDAIDALLAVQTAQDRHFASLARYADNASLPVAAPAGLGLDAASKHGYYQIEIQRAADELAYVAIARITKGKGRNDARCAELRLDEHGRRFAASESGEDTTADCWSRK